VDDLDAEAVVQLRNEHFDTLIAQDRDFPPHDVGLDGQFPPTTINDHT
jgi:hypothetical protein